MRSPARTIEYLVGIFGNAAGALRAVRLQQPQAWRKVDGAFQRLQAVAEAGPRNGLMDEEQAKAWGQLLQQLADSGKRVAASVRIEDLTEVEALLWGWQEACKDIAKDLMTVEKGKDRKGG